MQGTVTISVSDFERLRECQKLADNIDKIEEEFEEAEMKGNKKLSEQDKMNRINGVIEAYMQNKWYNGRY